MISKKFFTVVSIACSMILGAGASHAQLLPSEQRAPAPEPELSDADKLAQTQVAAIVNDSVITTYDVRQRMRLMFLSADGQIPPEAMGQLQQQAIRDLIEEKLKLQQTAEYEIFAPESEVEEQVASIAIQSNMEPSTFEAMLATQGVKLDTLKNQLRANIVWPQLVQGRFRDRIRINDDEIDATIERMREDASQEQFLLSEICIAVPDPSQAQQYYEGSLQLIEQMRKGVPFTVIAQQFSACTTAAVGGDLGWVRAGELEPELDRAVRELPPGSVTNPIPSEGAFMIMAVRDKRAAVVAGEPTFTLGYVTAPESMGDTAARAAFDKLPNALICTGSELRVDLGENVGYAFLENMTLDKIDERFRDSIEYLNRGETSPIIRAGGAFHQVYVCDKDEGLGLPSRGAVESRIFNRQLSRISQQYLRDVERNSTVEVRLKEPLPIGG